MKSKFSSVGLFLLSLTVSLSAYAFAGNADVCRSVLSDYLQAIRSGGPRNWSKEMEATLDTAREAQGVDPVPFSAVSDLIPLFNSGIVHRAIAQELISRGHQTTRDMKDVLSAFGHLDASKQIDFVDAVVMRLLYSVKDVSIEGEKFRQMRKDAESYQMDLETYMRFVDAWTTQRASNYLTIKLAILDNLRNPNQPMNDPVGSHGSRFGFMKSKLANEKPLMMPPAAKESTLAALVLAEGQEAFPDLTKFFKEAPLVGSTIFVESHFQKFSRPQLNQVVTNPDILSSLSPQLQEELHGRLTWFNELYLQHGRLVESLAAVDEQIATLTASIDEAKALLGTSTEIISSPEFGVLKEMLGRISGFSSSDSAVTTVYSTFGDYAGRLNGDQYSALANHTMRSTGNFTATANIIRIAEALNKYSRGVV